MRYTRKFSAEGLPCAVVYRVGLTRAESTLTICDVEHARDSVPVSGAGSARNHHLAARLPSGTLLEAEAGYNSWTNIGIAARVDGVLVHESHPGKPITIPASARKMMGVAEGSTDSTYDMAKLERNKVPIIVDLVTGLLFFVIAKLTDLTTAALIGAAIGLALAAVQRIWKIDLLGGLASFGIIMLLISAALAWYYQDDDMVKLRSTIVGLIGAAAFLTDGLFGGRWLGKGMARYIVYSDIREGRLALSMGLVGLAMAGANWVALKLLSTDGWLFYTTFVDIFFTMGLVMLAINWSRHPAKRA